MAFEFDRYINGTLMAEGVIIERQKNLADAMREAARIASRGPNGEMPVLVLRAEAAERALAERAGGVKVRPLEWEERVGVDGTFDAYTSIGHYIATITDDDRGMWFVVGLTQSNYCAPDIDIVKAAAQADYERRILSALSPAPEAQQEPDPFRAAAPELLEAMKQAEQQIDYGQIDAAHRIIIAAIAKAEGRADG